jgi:hypothetical protein
MSDETSLAAILGRESVRPQVVSECVALIDQHVKAKSGLSGVAIKGAYGTIKRIKPRFVPEVIDGLLDDWLAQVQPYYDRWRSGGAGSLTEHLTARSDDVAEDLLSVTDGRAEGTKHTTAKKMYLRMRPSAKKNVIDAIPDLGRLIERHLEAARAGDSSESTDTTAA